LQYQLKIKFKRRKTDSIVRKKAFVEDEWHDDLLIAQEQKELLHL